MNSPFFGSIRLDDEKSIQNFFFFQFVTFLHYMYARATHSFIASERDVPPQKLRKMVIFKVNLRDLVHTFLPGRPHKVRRPVSAKNRGSARQGRPL